MKPKSRRYAGTRGLARPAAAGYLLYFRCRFDTTLDQGSRIPIKVRLKTGSSTQGRRSSACSAANKIRHDNQLEDPSRFLTFGGSATRSTLLEFGPGQAVAHSCSDLAFARGARASLPAPARLTAGSTERRNSQRTYFWTGAARETGA